MEFYISLYHQLYDAAIRELKEAGNASPSQDEINGTVVEKLMYRMSCLKRERNQLRETKAAVNALQPLIWSRHSGSLSWRQRKKESGRLSCDA
jgi:hypothetical protein